MNGSQQGLDLCVRLLLDPGEPAVIEDPCYAAARDVLLAAGARLVPGRWIGKACSRNGSRPPGWPT